MLARPALCSAVQIGGAVVRRRRLHQNSDNFQFFRGGGMEKGEGAARRASRGAEARVRAEGEKVERTM